MLRDLVEYLIGQSRPITKEVGGFVHPVSAGGVVQMEPIAPPDRPTVDVVTLSGLVDAYNAQMMPNEADIFVLIENHTKVSVAPKFADGFGRRTPYVSAKCDETIAFRFGEYYQPESFIIAFHSSFVPTDNFYAVIKLVSSLSTENSIQTSDDGLAQKVVVNTGTVKRGEVAIAPRVALAPYRTFREANAVESEFLIRLKGKPGELPLIALIEVDSGKWKVDAIGSVKHWLEGRLKTATIIA